MKDKKYALFAGQRYYPQGGANDFRGFFGTIEEAQKYFVDNASLIGEEWFENWGHIVDEEVNVLYWGSVEHKEGEAYVAGLPEWRRANDSNQD